LGLTSPPGGRSGRHRVLDPPWKRHRRGRRSLRNERTGPGGMVGSNGGFGQKSRSCVTKGFCPPRTVGRDGQFNRGA